MAEKFKKRLSRRSQERLIRALRVFDLTMLGLLLVAVLCFAISYFRGADLKAHASSGFAYWFLVVIGYPPMLFVNAVRATCGMAIPAPGPHGELFLVSVTDLVWGICLWLTIRIVGKRETKSQLLEISTRLAQIILGWGVFQLCCVVLTINFNRSTRAVEKPRAPKIEAARPSAPTPAKPDAPKK